MLKIDKLAPNTRKVFDFLSACELLKSFSLIGGTALALQIGHRISEDLDFWLPANQLNRSDISNLIKAAQTSGLTVQLLTPKQKIVEAKINGVDLLAFAQDYAIEGVKVTFFARNDLAFKHFNTFSRVGGTRYSFDIMGAEGIFAMKSYVIHQRVKSRDLFDLKTFVLLGKTVDDILRAGLAADVTCTPDVAKEVLLGRLPLDKDDEGFESLGIKEKVNDIYEFFTSAINAFEVQQAQKIASDNLCKICEAFACVCEQDGLRLSTPKF